ncbi:MAG: nucleotidyl transferase AbiEii/AbiGii toxin family protein [Candidatus Eisenbacteria bacterium]
MERRSVESLVRALNEAGVRYLIVGGLAVVAHGHARFTGDVDLVLDLDAGNLGRAVDAFESLHYRPRAPVPFRDFADASKRAEWLSTKGLTVFSASSPEHSATEIDLFVETPFDFAEVYARAVRFEVAPGVEAPFVPVDDLIAMKRRAGRPIDLDDARVLEALKPGGGHQP